MAQSMERCPGRSLLGSNVHVRDHFTSLHRTEHFTVIDPGCRSGPEMESVHSMAALSRMLSSDRRRWSTWHGGACMDPPHGGACMGSWS
jgi:hypothetical protein